MRRETGGSKFYPLPMTDEEFLHAVRLGIHDLRAYAHSTLRDFNVCAVSVDTKRVGDRVSVHVEADLHAGIKGADQ